MSDSEPTKRDYMDMKEKWQATKAQLEEVKKNSAKNIWRDLALQVLKSVRLQVFDRCTCKSKAFMTYCERYSCRHLLSLLHQLDQLAVSEGSLEPMRLQRARFSGETGRNPVNRPDVPWESQTLNPAYRDFDESGHAVTTGRGVGLPDQGPKTITVKEAPA